MNQKKALNFCWVLVILLILTACGQASADSTLKESPVIRAQIFFVPSAGVIDDRGFNQAAWETVQAYANEKQWKCASIIPKEQSETAYEAALQTAAAGGAKVIVALGNWMETPVYKVQEQFPNVNFLLIDGNPEDGNGTYETDPNCVGILYAEEQAGYLAGYGAVMEGYTKIGFLGGVESPAVIRYGYGFLQGAEAAAQERGIANVEAKYQYTGTFLASSEVEARAASWYQGGTEVIFACGGEMGLSVMAAAEQNNGQVIGADIDQSSLSSTVLTSAMKHVAGSMEEVLNQYDADAFPGGESLLFDASNSGIGLDMEHARFQVFTKEQYEAVYEKLKNLELVPLKDTKEDGQPLKLTDLPFQAVQFGVVG